MKELILIIEDSLTQAMILENFLQKHHYEVSIASNGQKALEWLTENNPKLVISDIVMPDISGFDLCRRIKLSVSTSHLPVILLTSLTDSSEIMKGIECGADSFVTKPYNEEFLLSIIKKLLSEDIGSEKTSKITGLEIPFEGKQRLIQADNSQVNKLLLSVYEGAIIQNLQLKKVQQELRLLNENLESLVKERTKALSEETEKSKQTIERIREKDILFQKLLSNVSDLIFQFTRKSDGTYCVPIASAGIKNIFGCSPDDVVEDFSPIAKVIFPEDSARVISDIEYSAEHLTYFTCEFRVQIPGKEIQWIYSRSTPEKLPDGSITWYGFNADITERKLAEQEIIRAKEQAEQSDRLKSAFLANVSHEIRTPMNGILGFAELLKEPDLSGEEQNEYIKIIEKSGARMLNIINDIVDISKIEAGLETINISEVNINGKIEFVYKFFKPEIEGKGIQLFFKNGLPNENAILQTDGEKLDAILINLIKNAAKFTNSGLIEIGYNLLETHGRASIQFYVKDTGIGIPKDRQNAVFERFIQADISDSKAYQGAGLGLSISKAYVEMLGGTIWVESEVGKGSAFHFTIPSFQKPKDNLELRAFDNYWKENSKEKSEISGLKILIVEDDETSELYLRSILKRFSEDIVSAPNGLEAVKICRSTPDIDLIMMDIKMPILDGYEATKQIRQFNKNVVIVAQTAFALVGDKENAIQAGCNDYISKPINILEFNSMLHSHFLK